MAVLDPQAHIAMLERELEWARPEDSSARRAAAATAYSILGPHSETLSDLQLELLAEVEPGVTREEVEAEARREPLPQSPQRNASHIRAAARCRRICRAWSRWFGAPSRTAEVRGGDLDHRLRRKRSAGRRTGALLRARDQARKACVREVRHHRDAGAGAAHRGKGLGERRGGDSNGDREVLRSPSVVPATSDAGTRSGRRNQPRHAGRLGDAGGRVAATGGGERCGRILLRASYLQADETTVPVQMHDKRGADHQAYLWQYGKPGGETVFEFQLGRGREGPRKFLGEWEGILQTDGYQAYDDVGGEKLVHVGCWAHARRKFVDAVKVNPKDAEAIKMVTRMDALFLVDRHARQQQLSVEERLALRREHADSWAAEIHDQCVSLRKTTLPKSALGQAVNYTLNMWPKLRRCFDYAEVELSNNLAENSMRPVALGRKNWLHVGSAQSGPKVAAILSVVESCRRLGVPVKDYLLAVLPGMAQRNLSKSPTHPCPLGRFPKLTWVGRTDTLHLNLGYLANVRGRS